MSNEKFQNALIRKPQAVPPVWFMRQAGRYHKHYQGLREKYGFMDLCKQPELASEVALGPIRDFDFDVSILFSDLLFPLEALGMGLEYNPAPQLGWTLTKKNFGDLKSKDEALPLLKFQHYAMKATRELLPKDKSLIGFIGGPWTLFTYAVEGSHKGSLNLAKSDFDLFRRFSEHILPLLIDNIQLQLSGGAELVMVFDTAAGELDPVQYNTYVVPELERLSVAYPGKLGYYSKGTQEAHLQDLWHTSHFVGFGYDHRWSLPNVWELQSKGFVQGNFDQALLFSDADQFERILTHYIESWKAIDPSKRAGWVCGLGHGVLPKTPEAHVKMFVERVRKEFE